ncbi:MAG: hypothetical protein QOH51_1546 [Acidobacteriota bacterium]|nr:hypothetical protein [Acidobacteriota bacterium]
MRDLHPDPAPPVSTSDEELCHVPDILFNGDFRPSLHQNETRQVAVNLDEKRIAVRLYPVEREMLVTESPIRAKLHVRELAEIVCIQLKQMSQYRLLLRCGRDDFDRQ